jgi:hypothetical protein
MTELQIGLIGLGVIAVIAVLAYNKWQERKVRRELAQTFSGDRSDVLLDDDVPPLPPAYARNPVAQERIEPGFTSPGASSSTNASTSAGTGMSEPDLAGSDAEDHAEPLSVTHPPLLDGRIDFIAELAFAEAVSGTQLMLEAEKFSTARTVACDGYNEGAQAWEALDRDAVYERARIGIQLTDRSGPIKAPELDGFQQAVARLGAVLDAQVGWPAAQNPLTQAAELDAFCAELDVLVSVNLMGAQPFAETKLKGLAEANGFVRDDAGNYARLDEMGHLILEMHQAAPNHLALSLDVPHVPRSVGAFVLFLQCAKRFATGLDARMLDDNQRPLDDAAFTRIQTGLNQLYGRLDAAALPAGGVLARRLFQ